MAARKRMSAGQIINALRKAEVGIANGKRIKEVKAKPVNWLPWSSHLVRVVSPNRPDVEG